MPKYEKRIEQPDKIVDDVGKIFDFNERYQERQGLKVLTSDEMLSRLQTTSSQLKSGNNSENLKNEIMQLLHSLYHSKK